MTPTPITADVRERLGKLVAAVQVKGPYKAEWIEESADWIVSGAQQPDGWQPFLLSDACGQAEAELVAEALNALPALLSSAPGWRLADRDEGRLALFQAIRAITYGNKTDDKLILEELRKLGFWVAALSSTPEPVQGDDYRASQGGGTSSVRLEEDFLLAEQAFKEGVAAGYLSGRVDPPDEHLTLHADAVNEAWAESATRKALGEREDALLSSQTQVKGKAPGMTLNPSEPGEGEAFPGAKAVGDYIDGIVAPLETNYRERIEALSQQNRRLREAGERAATQLGNIAYNHGQSPRPADEIVRALKDIIAGLDAALSEKS